MRGMKPRRAVKVGLSGVINRSVAVRTLCEVA